MKRLLWVLWVLMGVSTASFGANLTRMGSFKENQLKALSIAYEAFERLPVRKPVVVYGSLTAYFEEQRLNPTPRSPGKEILYPGKEWCVMWLEGEDYFSVWFFGGRDGQLFGMEMGGGARYTVSKEDFRIVDEKSLMLSGRNSERVSILSKNHLGAALVAYQVFKELPEVDPGNKHKYRGFSMEEFRQQMLLERESLREGEQLSIGLTEKSDGNFVVSFSNSKIEPDFVFRGGGGKEFKYTVSRETLEIIEKEAYFAR